MYVCLHVREGAVCVFCWWLFCLTRSFIHSLQGRITFRSVSILSQRHVIWLLFQFVFLKVNPKTLPPFCGHTISHYPDYFAICVFAFLFRFSLFCPFFCFHLLLSICRVCWCVGLFCSQASVLLFYSRLLLNKNQLILLHIIQRIEIIFTIPCGNFFLTN